VKGSITISLDTEKFRQMVVMLSMYQNASLIDDLEFEVSDDTINFCQTEDLVHLMAKADIPLTFFDRFEIKGEVKKFILPVRKIVTSVDSMFRIYPKITIKVKIGDDGSEIISLTSKKETFEVKSPENPRVIKDVAVQSIEQFDKLKPIANFTCKPSEMVDIGYNDNTAINIHILQKNADFVFVTSESDLSGTKYAKKASVKDKIHNEDYKFRYNLEYLKHILINQIDEVSFIIYEKGLMQVVQHKPFVAIFYLSPLEDED